MTYGIKLLKKIHQESLKVNPYLAINPKMQCIKMEYKALYNFQNIKLGLNIMFQWKETHLKESKAVGRVQNKHLLLKKL